MAPKRRLRIGLLSAWASRLGGGVFEALVAHADIVRFCGDEPVIFALEDEHSAADRVRFRDVEVTTCSVVGPVSPGFAPTLTPALKAARLDVLHLHGIWLYPSRAAGNWATATGRPLVISPHGMLDPWITARGRLKKAIARVGYERRSWRLASRFHALTDREADDIARETGRTDRALVVPNAVPPAAVVGVRDRAPILACLGRIHPKKNLHALIDGWEAAADLLRPQGARLLIAGWGDEPDVAALRARIAQHGGDDIVFLGPVYGAQKAGLLADARFLVLPSYSEGLPMVVLEAWAAGTPTIMTAHCNLPRGFACGAAIECGTDVHDIAAALRRAFVLPAPAWDAASAAASRLATTDFSLREVTAIWKSAYAGLAVHRPDR